MLKKLLTILLILSFLYLVKEAYYYVLVWKNLPVGTTIAGVKVDQLDFQEAAEKIADVYAEQVDLQSFETDGNPIAYISISPHRFGFELQLQPMLDEAQRQKNEISWWEGYISYVLKRPLDPIDIPLQATHDKEKLLSMTEMIGETLSSSPLPARIDPDTFRFLNGTDGYLPNVEETAAMIQVALYDPEPNIVTYQLTYQPVPEFTLQLLKQVLEDKLSLYTDLVPGIYIQDLQTGEEISINGEIPFAGISTMKIPILVETYRALDNAPGFNDQNHINQMITESSDLGANLLLDVVAGQDNAYLGVDILTESMHKLGLLNTFIVTPYQEPTRPSRPTLSTPANSMENLPADLDTAMQTTVTDLGTLLAMIYECTQDRGAFRLVYPESLTPEECQAMVDVLVLNTEGNLIRYGVPDGVPVAHKHGWAINTHADAGIVYSEGRDFVVVTFVNQPGSEWLIADYSFPVLRDMTRIAYNYFNPDAPYTGYRQIELDAQAEEAARKAGLPYTPTTALTTTVTDTVIVTDTLVITDTIAIEE